MEEKGEIKERYYNVKVSNNGVEGNKERREGKENRGMEGWKEGRK